MMQLRQVVRENGEYEAASEPKVGADELRAMYKAMVQVRLLDERGMLLQRQGRIGFYISAQGQEAVHVGAAAALQPADWYFPHYRDVGVALLRGASFRDIFNQLFGNAEDLIKGRQMPNHFAFRAQNYNSVSSPLSTQIPQATGAAYAMKYLGKKEVAMVSFGDGSTSEGDFHVGLNFAAVWKTPAVFVCNNNQWAISVPLKKQTASESIAVKALAYGMPGVRVDGNDILAVYSAAKEAVDRARRGEGPTLIECVTYRMSSHSSSDDAARYVPKEELDRWAKKDPIVRFGTYLRRKGLWDDAREREFVEATKHALEEAFQHAEKVGKPRFEEIFNDTYAEWIPQYGEQIKELQDAHPEGA
ncbi:MAG TPA: pyruvate dehydrogenase (acetyl-transferring) E1 component subunit alpha [Candidatus Thermoplasmatota archaeon]|nr:pyruvate dehydrogenase (acetyl-transferring) E1 component subunit alpha [Candidatus Thermoplasmatota archaeon]